MGKHAQSRGRYPAWSHSRVFPALKSSGQYRTGLGGGLCNRLSVWYAFFLCQLHMVSRQSPGQVERAASQIRSRGDLPAHCGNVYPVHTACHEACRGLGLGYFLFCLAVGYRRLHTEFQETERTQQSGNGLLRSHGSQHSGGHETSDG